MGMPYQVITAERVISLKIHEWVAQYEKAFMSLAEDGWS
jgi:hypothetical protein